MLFYKGNSQFTYFIFLCILFQLVIPENLPQSTLSLLLSKEKNKQGAVDTISAKKDVKSWKGVGVLMENLDRYLNKIMP